MNRVTATRRDTPIIFSRVALIAAALTLAAPAAVSTATPATTASGAAEAFGQTIIETLQSGNGEAFSGLIDSTGLIDRTVTGMEGNESFVAGVRKGLGVALPRVGTVLVNNMGPEVQLKYLRVRTIDGEKRALVRVDLGDRGINYFDFFVQPQADGTWGIVDWQDYAQGLRYTESLRMTMALMTQGEPSLLGKLLGVSNVDTKLAKQIREIGTRGRNGDWAGWLEVYHKLPEAARAHRVLLANRIGAATYIGNDDEYLAGMSDLHAWHGDDPTLSLLLVDYYMLTGDYDRAYRAVDLLDEFIGRDAAITNLRSGIALTQGDNALSIRAAKRAIEQDPDYEGPYWNLMVAAARAGDYQAAMDGVIGLETRFGVEFLEDQLRENAELAGLADSDEWRGAHP